MVYLPDDGFVTAVCGGFSSLCHQSFTSGGDDIGMHIEASA
jgi:hypothetical protein